MNRRIIKIRDNPNLIQICSEWFHQKWGIPVEAYRNSMEESLYQAPVPQWYVVLEDNQLIAGLGVIENDFHERKDLSPNICAVYVEETHRNQGIAGQMLDFACKDMQQLGISTLYLLTNHASFYERYGWSFFCLVKGDEEETLSRMYIHQMNNKLVI